MSKPTALPKCGLGWNSRSLTMIGYLPEAAT